MGKKAKAVALLENLLKAMSQSSLAEDRVKARAITKRQGTIMILLMVLIKSLTTRDRRMTETVTPESHQCFS